jgi:hypothetical protein
MLLFMMIKDFCRIFILFFFGLQALCGYSKTPEPLIFPIPSEVQMKDGKFNIDKTTFLMVPERANHDDNFLAKFLVNDLADKYEHSLNIIKRSIFSESDKFILIGSVSNPLVKKYCEQKGLVSSLKTLGDEGYILSVTKNNIVIAANSKRGALFGLQSLRQIIQKENENIFLPQLFVKDAPKYPFRGIKLYLPGKENIQFFKRFIKDFAALYKFNKIILELNANMRLEKHPELNIGAVQFAGHLNYSRLDRPPGVHQEYQNSSHQDNADGQILEKEEVADIVNYIRKFNIEVIPELPSLTHSYYLLAGHEELAENLNQPYPDTYCPLKPGSYKIYFDVLDEYIDVIHPKMIHVGHDEWRMEKDLCELCRGKDYGELYANDLKKIHNYLAAKNIKTAIWGDHLLESVTEKGRQTWKSSTGYQYKIPGALRPEQVMQLIPKDILIFNWFWNNIDNDKEISNFGFKQVYGNLRADVNNWSVRDKIKGVLGGAPSSWAATTEYNIGKDQLTDFLGAANLLWSQTYLSVDKLAFFIEPLVSDVYKSLSEKNLPSENGAITTSLNISSSFNSSLPQGITNLKSGEKKAIIVEDDIRSAKVIQLSKDVSSIIFLHACAREANNDKAYGMIYNFVDTAEPLGWYEIVYEDGLIENVPIRYGVNILDWKWRQRIMSNEKDKGKYSQNKYAYNAAAVECSKDDLNPVTFFSFEWKNPRFGKKIKEVNLRSVNYKKGNENAIILLAVSITENEKIINATGSEAQ